MISLKGTRNILWVIHICLKSWKFFYLVVWLIPSIICTYIHYYRLSQHHQSRQAAVVINRHQVVRHLQLWNHIRLHHLQRLWKRILILRIIIQVMDQRRHHPATRILRPPGPFLTWVCYYHYLLLFIEYHY